MNRYICPVCGRDCYSAASIDQLRNTRCPYTKCVGTIEPSPEESVPAAEGLYIQEQQPTKAHRATFVPPTLDEVRAYCRERGNRIDPARFIDYYVANGWHAGKQKMRDWRAAVRNWERMDGHEANGRGTEAPPPGCGDYL